MRMTAAPSSALIEAQSAISAIPALPGETMSLSHLGFCITAQASECSRPPPPRMRMFTVAPPLVKLRADKQETGRAGKMRDHDKEEDALNEPGFPASIALMLAPLFLILGFVLLWFGKTDGGFISFVLSVFALVSGLIRGARGKQDE